MWTAKCRELKIAAFCGKENNFTHSGNKWNCDSKASPLEINRKSQCCETEIELLLSRLCRTWSEMAFVDPTIIPSEIGLFVNFK